MTAVFWGHKLSFLWISLTLFTPQLLSVIVVHVRGYWNPFVQKASVLRQDVNIFSRQSQPGLWLVRAQVVDHPSYSLDLEPSNFHLIGLLKKHLRIKRFPTDADAKQAVTSWPQTLHSDFFYAGIQALVQRWDKCQWRYRGGLMCSICHPCAIYTSKSEYISRYLGLLAYFFKELFVSNDLPQNLVPHLLSCSLSQHVTQPVAESPRSVISELRVLQTVECCAENTDGNVWEQYT